MQDNYEITKEDFLSLTTENINKIVESKKLQMNYIWCTKISQEDLNTPKILEDPGQHLQMLSNLFQSIVRLANKINEVFENLINTNTGELSESNFEELCYSFMITTSALVRKLKNFIELKNKQFKKEKNAIEPLIKLQKYFGLFKLNFKGSLSKKLEEFYQHICEFINNLENDNHLNIFCVKN
jgi:hypothetical protein